MADFDINKLINEQHIIQQKKLDVYNKILRKLYVKIELINKRKKTELIYEVPNYIFGYPLYDNRTCIVFIMSSLRKKSFYVKFNYPNILFISWKSMISNNIKNITYNLIKKNDDDHKINNSHNMLDKHFKKENKKILDDIDSIIQTNNSFDDFDYDDDLKKLNDLSDFAKKI